MRLELEGKDPRLWPLMSKRPERVLLNFTQVLKVQSESQDSAPTPVGQKVLWPFPTLAGGYVFASPWPDSLMSCWRVHIFLAPHPATAPRPVPTSTISVPRKAGDFREPTKAKASFLEIPYEPRRAKRKLLTPVARCCSLEVSRPGGVLARPPQPCN